MITIGLPSLPKSLDATQLMLANHFLLLQCFCQTLVRINEVGDSVGDAAESWKFSDGGKTVIFNLKPNLKFSDGTSLEAADFAHAIHRQLQPHSTTAVGGYLKRVTEPGDAVKAISKTSLEIRLKYPYGPLLHMLAMPGFCAQKEAKGSPAGFIGSGPLVVTEFSSLVLRMKRNPNYSGEARLNEVTVKAVAELGTSLDKVAFDDLDLILGVAPDLIEGKQIAGFSALPLESLAIAHLYFNVESRPDLDLATRQKIRGILSPIANDFKSPFCEPISHFFPRGVLPEKYYRQSDVAGKVTADLKGVKPIVIKVLATVFGQKLADAVVKNLASAGLQAQVIRLAPPDFMQVLKTGDYDLLGSSYILNFPDADAAIDPLDKHSAVRLGRYDSSHLMTRLDAVRGSTDTAKRLSEYSDALAEFEDQNYIVPLFRLRLPALHRKELVIPETTFRYEAELWKILWQR